MRNKDTSIGQNVRLKFDIKYGESVIYPYGSIGVVVEKVKSVEPQYFEYTKPLEKIKSVIVRMNVEVEPFPKEIQIPLGNLDDMPFSGCQYCKHDISCTKNVCRFHDKEDNR